MMMPTNGRKYRRVPELEISGSHHAHDSVMPPPALRHDTPWAASGLPEEVADPGFAAALLLSAV
jgi:hypothetical protein